MYFVTCILLIQNATSRVRLAWSLARSKIGRYPLLPHIQTIGTKVATRGTPGSTNQTVSVGAPSTKHRRSGSKLTSVLPPRLVPVYNNIVNGAAHTSLKCVTILNIVIDFMDASNVSSAKRVYCFSSSHISLQAWLSSILRIQKNYFRNLSQYYFRRKYYFVAYHNTTSSGSSIRYSQSGYLRIWEVLYYTDTLLNLMILYLFCWWNNIEFFWVRPKLWECHYSNTLFIIIRFIIFEFSIFCQAVRVMFTL